MTVLIEEDSDSVEKQSDAPDGEASNEGEGLRRSKRKLHVD
jgi:hypothetical protein